MKKIAGLEPLPVYSQDKEAEFLQLMLEKSKRLGEEKTLTKDLTQVAANIEECLKLSEDACKALGFDEQESRRFLPETENATQLCKSLLEKVSMATCLKLLHSRAAANKASTISDSLSSVLDFISVNAVTIPSEVMSRMTELQKQLAVPPAKRAKTAHTK